ncbi:MAG: hypothetical protein GF330_00290 [Candidatus Eisenbacteria bacterium]|nr:hypothetical protein [Candidatus Eisenbacteria bacterium]
MRPIEHRATEGLLALGVLLLVAGCASSPSNRNVVETAAPAELAIMRAVETLREVGAQVEWVKEETGAISGSWRPEQNAEAAPVRVGIAVVDRGMVDPTSLTITADSRDGDIATAQEFTRRFIEAFEARVPIIEIERVEPLGPGMPSGAPKGYDRAGRIDTTIKCTPGDLRTACQLQ